MSRIMSSMDKWLLSQMGGKEHYKEWHEFNYELHGQVAAQSDG